ncbi:hypothetical protein [Candidatus Avelusimicrobium alvi]|uniref:hypothetical protein n=1 Tax=Candidatus Avelusimicrobium alvi TaxID=3416221 RepID=UPI003D0D1305
MSSKIFTRPPVVWGRFFMGIFPGGQGAGQIVYDTFTCKQKCEPMEYYAPRWDPATDKNY